jgi:hypothetical protein
VNILMDEREARLVNQVSTLFHNANLKKPVNVASVMPSCPMPMSSTPKTVDFPALWHADEFP